MRTICLNHLSWRSYTTLCTMIFACIGFALSIILVLLVHVVHVEFSIRFSGFYIDGGLFSIVSVFIGPFVGATMGFLGSIITHPMFELMLSQFSGLPLKGVGLDSEEFKAGDIECSLLSDFKSGRQDSRTEALLRRARAHP